MHSRTNDLKGRIHPPSVGEFRVCFFPGRLDLGGIGRVIQHLATEMIGRGVEVDLFLLEGSGRLESELPEGLRIFRGGRTTKSSVMPFLRYLRREQPQVVVSARDQLNLASLLAVRLTSKKIRHISTVHTTYEYLEAKREEYTLKQRLWHKWVHVAGRISYRWADQIVAVSEGVAIDFSRKFAIPKEQIEVIYNPAYNPASVVKNGGIKSKEETLPPHIVGVGRLTFQKDFRTLVRAFDLVRREVPEAYLTIYGEGEERGALESLIANLELGECVSLPGYIPDVASKLVDADVFVLSSRYEGFGVVLVEALAAGLPVVSTDCKSGPAEILGNGRWGHLVGVGEVDEMAEAILTSLETDVDGQSQRDRASAFATPVVTDRYLRIMFPEWEGG